MCKPQSLSHSFSHNSWLTVSVNLLRWQQDFYYYTNLINSKRFSNLSNFKVVICSARAYDLHPKYKLHMSQKSIFSFFLLFAFHSSFLFIQKKIHSRWIAGVLVCENLFGNRSTSTQIANALTLYEYDRVAVKVFQSSINRVIAK